MNDSRADAPNCNPMIEGMIADARSIGIHQAAAEFLGEILGHFDNDPVADFGQQAVDQTRELIEMILDTTTEV